MGRNDQDRGGGRGQSVRCLQNMKIRVTKKKKFFFKSGLPYDPAIPLLVSAQKNSKQGLEEIPKPHTHNSPEVAAAQVSLGK